MEKKSVLDKVKDFLKAVEIDDPAPIPLECSGDGPYIEMELGLGIYDVKDTSKLQVDGEGTLIPELLENDSEPSPAPLIEELKTRN